VLLGRRNEVNTKVCNLLDAPHRAKLGKLSELNRAKAIFFKNILNFLYKNIT
jgi:hypothetical protein